MYLNRVCDDLYQKIVQNLKSFFFFSLHSISINTVLSELYVMQNPRAITMVTRPVAMETPAHARVVCTMPFLLLLLKGLGTRLGQGKCTC